VEKMLSILTVEFYEKAVNILIINLLNQLTSLEPLKMKKEKQLNSLLFTNILKKVAEHKIISSKKLNIVSKLGETEAKK
jgi:hypothetical protein